MTSCLRLNSNWFTNDRRPVGRHHFIIGTKLIFVRGDKRLLQISVRRHFTTKGGMSRHVTHFTRRVIYNLKVKVLKGGNEHESRVEGLGYGAWCRFNRFWRVWYITAIGFGRKRVGASSTMIHLELSLNRLSSMILLTSFLKQTIMRPILYIITKGRTITPEGPSDGNDTSSRKTFSNDTSDKTKRGIRIFCLTTHDGGPGTPSGSTL